MANFKKIKESKSGEAAQKKISKWKFYDAMKFCQPTIVSRVGIESITSSVGSSSPIVGSVASPSAALDSILALNSIAPSTSAAVHSIPSSSARFNIGSHDTIPFDSSRYDDLSDTSNDPPENVEQNTNKGVGNPNSMFQAPDPDFDDILRATEEEEPDFNYSKRGEFFRYQFEFFKH